MYHKYSQPLIQPYKAYEHIVQLIKHKRFMQLFMMLFKASKLRIQKQKGESFVTAYR